MRVDDIGGSACGEHLSDHAAVGQREVKNGESRPSQREGDRRLALVATPHLPDHSSRSDHRNRPGAGAFQDGDDVALAVLEAYERSRVEHQPGHAASVAGRAVSLLRISSAVAISSDVIATSSR